MNKKIIAIGVSALILGLGIYHYRNYNYLKPSEVIQEVRKERELNKDKRNLVEGQIDSYNFYLKNKDKEKLRELFFSDCSISKYSQDRYLEDILSKDNLIEFEFLHYNPKKKISYNIGVSVNGKPDSIIGESIDGLHFKCNYFEDFEEVRQDVKPIEVKPEIPKQNYTEDSRKYCINVSSFLEIKYALDLKRKLEDNGIFTYVVQVDINGQAWNRVVLTDIKTKEEANRMMGELMNNFPEIKSPFLCRHE